MVGEVTGSDASLNTRKGFPLLAPCLSIYTRLFQRSIAETAGIPIYPSANFRPFLLFATPLKEASGATACCSAILDWLSGSPAEAEQAPDCIRFPKPWESSITLASGRTSKFRFDGNCFDTFACSDKSICWPAEKCEIQAHTCARNTAGLNLVTRL
jgi:hypothetical protein